jgi:hypothetical protein
MRRDEICSLLDKLCDSASRAEALHMNANACQTTYDRRKAVEAQDAFAATYQEVEDKIAAALGVK